MLYDCVVSLKVSVHLNCWCFAYGEEEWTAHTVNDDGSVTYGPSFTEAKNQTRRIRLGIPEADDENYEVSCQ